MQLLYLALGYDPREASRGLLEILSSTDDRLTSTGYATVFGPVHDTLEMAIGTHLRILPPQPIVLRVQPTLTMIEAHDNKRSY